MHPHPISIQIRNFMHRRDFDQHYLLSRESKECLALCRISVFAMKLLETQSNSDAEAISAAGKELK